MSSCTNVNCNSLFEATEFSVVVRTNTSEELCRAFDIHERILLPRRVNTRKYIGTYLSKSVSSTYTSLKIFVSKSKTKSTEINKYGQKADKWGHKQL